MDKTEKIIDQALKDLEEIKSLIESGAIKDKSNLDIIQVAINGIHIINSRYTGQKLKKDPNKFIDNYREEHIKRHE